MGEKLNSTTMKQRRHYTDTMVSSRNYLFNGVFIACFNPKEGFHNG